MPVLDDLWTIDPAAFPADGTNEAQLRFLVRYAVLAPSSHNTQPWQFIVGENMLSLYADRQRCLPVVDPVDRALVMSCGAALFFLRTAACHFGRTPEVERFPDAADPDFLASVRLGEVCGEAPEAEALFEAIPHRRTNRRPFAEAPLPPGLPNALRRAAKAEGAHLRLFTDGDDKAALADLIAEGDRIQFDDEAFRNELAAWIRSPSAGDGLALHSQGAPQALNIAAPVVAAVIRRFDVGDGTAARDHDLAEGAPTLALLMTEKDTPLEWLRAGEALGHVLLRAQVEGVQASFLNQPVEVPELRGRLRDVFCPGSHPQLLFRMGSGPDVEPSARRPIYEVRR